MPTGGVLMRVGRHTVDDELRMAVGGDPDEVNYALTLGIRLSFML